MAGSIQFLDITVDDGQPEEGLSRILEAVKPHWVLSEACRCPLVGGCINAMYCCHVAQDKDRSDAVIVRIYRGFLAGGLDRNKEFLSIQVAQSSGLHAPIHAVFNNGLVYKYVPGRLPSLHDLGNPKVIRELARALFRLHQTHSGKAYEGTCRIPRQNGDGRGIASARFVWIVKAIESVARPHVVCRY